MQHLFKTVIYILTAVFAVGAAGCLIVIPLTAGKFFSVLTEREETDAEAQPQD